MARLVPALATFAAVTLLLPVPASAQFGALKKKAQSAATGAVTGPAAAATADATRREIDDMGSLTLDEVGRVQQGFAAELAAAPKAKQEAEARQKKQESERQAYERARLDYDKRRATWRACRDKEDDAQDKRSGEAEKELEALQARMKRAMEAGNMEEVQRLTQEAMKVGGKAMDGGPAMSKCGEEPKAPPAPDNTFWSPEEVLLQEGAKAAGMEPRVYRVTREMVILYSAMTVKPGKKYSEPDAAAFNQKFTEVRATTAQMQKAGIPL